MSHVIHVDWEAWGQTDAKVRRLCGSRAFVMLPAENDNADVPEVVVDVAPAIVPDAHGDALLPGVAAWLAKARRRST